jgi:hypothetical protein
MDDPGGAVARVSVDQPAARLLARTAELFGIPATTAGTRSTAAAPRPATAVQKAM